MEKSQRPPPQAVGVNGKAGDLGAAAPALCAGELHARGSSRITTVP